MQLYHLDDVQRIGIPLSVWVMIAHADHQNDIRRLPLIAVVKLAVGQLDLNIGLGRNVGFRVFILADANGDKLPVDAQRAFLVYRTVQLEVLEKRGEIPDKGILQCCLLYTSDAADE